MYPRFLAGPVGARRTYTDPVTNAVVVTDADPSEVAVQIAAGRFSQPFIGPFLHEAAHHACFDTPVGLALSALKMAHTASPVLKMKDADRLEGPVRDLVKAETIIELFNPVLEGLALFAEFDLHPGPSPLASSVCQSAFRIFGLSRSLTAFVEAGPQGAYDDFSRFLLEVRSSPNFVERKIALLSSSLRSPDGYLLGYLFIKNLWWLSRSARAANRCNRNGSVSAPSSTVMNGTLWTMREETKFMSRLRSSIHRQFKNCSTHVSLINDLVLGYRPDTRAVHERARFWQPRARLAGSFPSQVMEAERRFVARD
jgi:hypothetical protein